MKPYLMFLSFYTFLSAQPLDTLWTKTLGGEEDEWSAQVIQTSDGGYAIVGYTATYGAGNGNVWLVKIDSKGDTLWTRTFGGPEEDWGSSIIQTSDGGYVILGRTESFGSGSTDAYLIRTDSSGNTLWTRTFGGEKDDWGHSIIKAIDGGYLLLGSTESFSQGEYMNIWVIKTDTSGDTLWTRTFGGIDLAAGYSLIQTSDEGYVILGDLLSVGYPDVYLIKIDIEGNLLWTNTFGGEYCDWGNSVIQTSDNGYLITGVTNFRGTGKKRDLYLAKVSNIGEVLWEKAFGKAAWGNSVIETKDRGYLITGCTYLNGAGGGDLWLVKTDPDGDTLWTRTFGGNREDWGRSIIPTSDGGCIITGGTLSFGGGKCDIWILKLIPKSGIGEGNALEKSCIRISSYPRSGGMDIRFSVPERTKVRVMVYDILGSLRATLLKEKQVEPGVEQRIALDGKCLTPGVYFLVITTDKGEQSSCKIIVVR